MYGRVADVEPWPARAEVTVAILLTVVIASAVVDGAVADVRRVTQRACTSGTSWVQYRHGWLWKHYFAADMSSTRRDIKHCARLQKKLVTTCIVCVHQFPCSICRGMGGFNPSLWCLSTPSQVFILHWFRHKYIKIHCWPHPMVLPQTDYCQFQIQIPRYIGNTVKWVSAAKWGIVSLHTPHGTYYIGANRVCRFQNLYVNEWMNEWINKWVNGSIIVKVTE